MTGPDHLPEGADAHISHSIGPYLIKKDAVDTRNGLLAAGAEARLLVAVLEDSRLPQPVRRHVEFVIKEDNGKIAGVSERVACQGWWQMQIADAENPHVEKVLTVEEGDVDTPTRYIMRRADYSLDTYLEQILKHEEDHSKKSFVAASIALQMAKGLAGVQRFAKKHGYRPCDVVHGDLKPANVLLRVTDGEVPFVTLIDFNGIAGREGDLRNSLSLGAAEGSREMATLRYMSPEQEQILYGNRDKDDIDLRSDIYSLGLVLVEMIGGHHGRRSISLPEDTNPALKGIIGKCLVENPEGRYATPEDLVVALEQFVNTMQGRAFAGPGQLIVSSGDLESLRDADSTDMTPDKAAAQGLLARLKDNELLKLATTLGLSTALGVLATVLGGLGTVTGALTGKAVEAASKAYERRKIVKAMMEELEEKYKEDEILGKIVMAIKADREIAPARRDEILSGALIQKLERLSDPEELKRHIQEAVQAAFQGRDSSLEDPLGIAQVVKAAVAEAMVGFSPEVKKKRHPIDIMVLAKRILEDFPHNSHLKSWLEGPKTRQNTRDMIDTLARLFSIKGSDMKYLCFGTSLSPTLLPKGASDDKQLWEWIVGDYLEAGALERETMQAGLDANFELHDISSRSDLLNALTRVYDTREKIVELCKLVHIDTLRVQNGEAKSIWTNLVFGGGLGEEDLRKLVEIAIKQIDLKFQA